MAVKNHPEESKEKELTGDSIRQSINAPGKNARIFQIGQARDIIIQTIGTWWFVPILITMMGGFTFLFFQLRETPPKQMTGDFRIAVAGFQIVGDRDAHELGKDLSNGVYLRMEETFDELKPNFTVMVWGPDLVGEIDGLDEKERAINARMIAENTKADVIVYGVIDATENPWEISPAFYLSDTNLSDAQELTGQHHIGLPFTASVRESLIATRIKISNQMAERTSLLALLVEGIAYYSIRDFSTALDKFRVVSDQNTWSRIGGEELIFLLIGNAALKVNDLELAEEAYKRSLDFDDEYARAYAGLGSLAYLRSLEIVKKDDGSQVPSDVDTDLLTESLNLFDNALEAKNQPELSDIESKVHFGRGQALLMLSFSNPEIAVNPAIPEFDAVIDTYRDGENPRIRDLAAESYARLGLIYAAIGQNEVAAEYYSKAVDLWFDNPEKQRIYQARLAGLSEE